MQTGSHEGGILDGGHGLPTAANNRHYEPNWRC